MLPIQKVNQTMQTESDIAQILASTVRSWAQRYALPEAGVRDASCRFDLSLYRKLDDELGVMNTTLPEDLSGSDLDISAPIAVIESLSMYDPALALSYLSQELLFAHQLYHTWRDLSRPIPLRHADILRAKPISGMAMTEPNAGTDVLAVQTTATKTESGYVLNGIKQWITNAPVAQYLLVYARTGQERRDMSLFLVDMHSAGIAVTPCEKKLGMRSSPTGIVTFADCHIADDSLVGNLHEGLRPMIRNLAVERLGLAAQSCGIAKTCVDCMKDYAAQRVAFGKKIDEFGQIQKMIAESYAKMRAMQTLIEATTQRIIDRHPDASIDADATKLFCATSAEEIARNAIQTLGANGYTEAYPVERLLRDAILIAIGGGTNEALQKNITRQLNRRHKVD